MPPIHPTPTNFTLNPIRFLGYDPTRPHVGTRGEPPSDPGRRRRRPRGLGQARASPDPFLNALYHRECPSDSGHQRGL